MNLIQNGCRINLPFIEVILVEDEKKITGSGYESEPAITY